MEDENDVVPAIVREKAKSVLRMFGIPLAVVLSVGLVAWALARSSGSMVVDKVDAQKEAKGLKGIVLRNYQSDDSFVRSSTYIEVLDPNDAVVKVFYTDGWGRCEAAHDEAVYSLAYGDKVEVYGKEVAEGVMSVCDYDSYYIRPVGKADAFAKWRSYVEPTAGASFKYPFSWTLSTSTYAGASIVKLSASTAEQPDVTVSSFLAKGFEIDEWIVNYYEPSTSQADADLDRLDVTVGDNPAVLVTRKDGTGGKAIIAKRGDRMIQFETRERSDEVGTAEKSKGLIADLILSTVTFDGGTTTAGTATGGAAATAPSSGLKGVVKLGPVCPAVRLDDAGECSDKPYAATFVVFDQSGRVVSRFSSGKDGRFLAPLYPGTYLISSESTERYPSFNQITVDIPQGKYLEATLMFDSGIR